MIPARRPASDHKDQEILRLKQQLAAANARSREVRAEERERFSALSAASRRFAHSMRYRMDERQRQQRRLDAQYAVSRALEESRDLLAAGPEVFRALGTRLGWDAGILWVVEAGTLVCKGIWRTDGVPAKGFGEACWEHRFPRGAGLPGRVWQREEPCWVEDVLKDGGYVRRGAVAGEGLRCAMAFPIQDGGRLVGVFEILKREPSPVDEELLGTMYLIGHQMGQFVERRRAEAERDRALFRERQARRQAGSILESINDAFFAVDRDWRLTYVNRRAEEFWRRSRGDLLDKVLWEAFPEAADSGVDHALLRAMEGTETVGLETFLPGSGVWVSVRAYPSADGLSVYLQDISGRKEAEAALRQSEVRYRTLAANIPGAVFRADVTDGRPVMQFVSDRIEEITGHPARDFVADSRRNYGDIVHPEDRPGNDREVWRALEERGHYNIEYRILHADGGIRWMNERGSGVFSEGGAVTSVDGVVFDITGRKRAEEKLRRTAELDAFRVALNDALRPLTDPAEVRAEACRLLGEHLGVDRAYYVEVDEAGGYARVKRDYLRGASPSPAGVFRLSDYGWTVPLLRRGEDIVVEDVQGSAVVPGADRGAMVTLGIASHIFIPLVKAGGLAGALCVTEPAPRRWTDTEIELVRETAGRIWSGVERARAQTALHKSEARWRALVDKGADVITISDRDGTIVFASTSIETVCGYKVEDFVGTVPFEDGLIHPEDVERCAGSFRELAENPGLSLTIQHRYRHGSGGWRWLEGTFTNLFDEEAIDGLVANFHDITERKRAEEERDRLLAVEWVASAEAAERERISRELHDRVAHSMGVAHQSLQLYEVLAVKDPEKAALKLDLAKATTKAALESTRNLSAELRQLEAEEGLEAELEHLLDVAVPPRIEARLRVEGEEANVPGHVRGQLFLVLREAVRNAVAHAGCDVITVDLDIASEGVVGRVGDDGQGFDVNRGRVGVGIRSMRERAALLDGTLEVSRQPGGGTLVEITVPLRGKR